MSIPLYDIIDISKHQGTVDWKKIKESKYRGAIIRCGYSWYDGGITLDEKFHYNIQQANLYGIPVGIYVYAYDKSVKAAEITANKVLALARQYDVSFGIYYDIENGQYRNFSKSKNTLIVNQFCKTIESNKYYVGVYSYLSFVDNYIKMQSLSRYDFWIAQYANNCTYSGNYGIWQYTSSGNVDGISGNVDINHVYKNYINIIKKTD